MNARCTRFAVAALIACCASLCFTKPIDNPSDISFPKVEKINEQIYMTMIRNALYDEKYDFLDYTAARLRKDKTRIVGGEWMLHIFYRGVIQPANGNSDTDENWLNHLKKVEKWTTVKTNSITAFVALARSVQGLGERARGTGYASTVSDKDMQRFIELAAHSAVILEKCRNFTERCPEWYMAMHHVNMTLGTSLEEYNKSFDESVKLEPLYYDIYVNKVLYLLPQWYGEHGDWERFVVSSSKQIGGKEGSMLLAYLTAGFLRMVRTTPSDALTIIPWSNLKQGYSDLKEVYGFDSLSLNAFCYYSVLAKDYSTANSIFTEIGDNWDRRVWIKIELFRDVRKQVMDIAKSSDAKEHEIILQR
jgi:hypothetical protein